MCCGAAAVFPDYSGPFILGGIMRYSLQQIAAGQSRADVLSTLP